MQLRFRRWLVFVLLAATAGTAQATRYEISLQDDVVASDGHCSIREAVQAINTASPVNECPAGDGRERIILLPGKKYRLNQGELMIGGGTDDNNQPVNPQVRFLLRNDLDDNNDNAILDLEGSGRGFTIHDKSRLTLVNMTVKNGDASASGGTDGGLIHVNAGGTLRLRTRTRLDSGVAQRGGLIFAEGAELKLQDRIHLLNGQATAGAGGALFLKGDTVMDAEKVTVDNNQASGDGGALALASDFSGRVSLSRSHLGSNQAGGTGGALALQGDRVRLISSNTTIASNAAAAGAGGLHFAAPVSNQDLAFNNVTFANNDSEPTSAYAASVYLEAGDSDDLIVNSVIVGDQSADDCFGTGFSNIPQEYNVLGSGCSAGGTNVDATAGGDSIQVLRNDAGNCTATPCAQADLEPFDGYLPAVDNSPTALGQGNPTETGINSCISEDQRGVSRFEQEQCDAGSIQFEKSVGREDEKDTVWGKTAVFDVLANDLGDSQVDCSNVPAGDECATVKIPPDRPEASVVFEIDSNGYPRARYMPGEKYHGLDRFAYRIHRDAFTLTRENRDVEAVTNVVSQPESGLQESDSIDQIGSFPLLGIALTVLMGLMRRYGAALLLLLLAAPANAVEIRVTSLADNTVNGDAECTFREAVISSRDDSVNPEPACEDGADGRDTIILPRGCITMDPSLGALRIQDPLTIRGEGPHGIDSSQGLNSNACSPQQDSNPDWTEGSIVRADSTPNSAGNRLITNESLLTIVDVSLLYGDSPLNGGAIRTSDDLTLRRTEFYQNRAGQSGGAIYLVGLSDPGAVQELSLRRSYFLDNTAGSNGGALAMAAAGHELEIAKSTFESNEAGSGGGSGSGGALNLAITKGQSWIVNSTFVGNVADAGAGGLDMREVVRDPSGTSPGTPGVNMVNNTIVDNTGSGPGGIDVGADQDSNGNDLQRDFRLTNSIIGSNSDNRCSSSASSDAEPFEEFSYNLVSDDAGALNTCSNSDNSSQTGNTFEGDTTIRDALAANTAYTAGGELDRFVAPNLAILEGETGTPDIVDSGNGNGVSSGSIGEAPLCRPSDGRTFERLSGAGCDRGAFEIQETTARDDNSRNRARLGNRVFVNVLQNDSTDPVKYEIDPTSINITQVEPLPSGDVPGVTSVYQTFPDVECDGDGDDQQQLEEARKENPDADFDPDDVQCVVLYNLRYTDPLAESTTPNEIACGDFPIRLTENGGTPALEYEFYAVDNNGNQDPPPSALPSEKFNSGNVYLEIRNPAPRIQSREVWNEQGEKVVIDLKVVDPLGPEGPNVDQRVDYDTLRLGSDPQFADQDENGQIVGTGIKLNEPEQGQITYVPGDVTKTFTDRFQVQVNDQCGEESTGATITIRYPEEDTSGGELLGGGSIWAWSLALLGLTGALRRRLRAGARRRR